MFTETWFPNRDGVVTSLASFRKGLEALGHEVHIFAAGSRETKEANTDKNVHIIPGMPWRKYPDYHLVLGGGPTGRQLRALGIDLIHAHGPATMGVKAVRIARFAGIPLLFTYHTRVDEATEYVVRKSQWQRRLKGLMGKWHAWYFGQCEVIVAPTEWVKNDLIKMTRIPPSKCRVIPTGVDVELFASGDRRAAREKYGLGEGKVVLSVGRVAQEKNLETLLDAAEAIGRKRDDVTFVVAGKGPMLEPLKAEADRRGLGQRVRFLGFVPDGDLPSLYKAADAFVLPSTFETQGMALLEAMAAGLAVATADTGGPTHFVEAEQNGFMFPGKDVAACAAAISKALGAGSEVRNRARQTAARYSVERQAKELADLYVEVMKHYASA